MKPYYLLETERAITFIKEKFEKELCKALNLVRVSSPIAVLDGFGLNDDLSGTEQPVSFTIKSQGGQRAQVVHSLAKWKRLRLMQYGVEPGNGIITDMKALRPEEEYTNLHSVFVDQWDWELALSPNERELSKFKEAVLAIYYSMQKTEKELIKDFSKLFTNPATEGWLCNSEPLLPPHIYFIHSQELLERYPTLPPKEREREIAKEYGAVAIIGIGASLTNGEPHDMRAPDYDDWSSINQEGYQGLNGDIIVWHPVLQCPMELSSMGVRVDSTSLIRQLQQRGCLEEKRELFYHSLLLQGALPHSMGGGIGQSRLCMYLLRKKHIGQVQVGLWNNEQRSRMAKEGVEVL